MKGWQKWHDEIRRRKKETFTWTPNVMQFLSYFIKNGQRDEWSTSAPCEKKCWM